MNASAAPMTALSDDAAAPLARGADPFLPRAEGLYDPANEHDSCGVGFVADMKNRKSHAILEKGLQILVNLDHRGAVGADAMLGDGCGVLTQIPHAFFARGMRQARHELARPRALRDRPVLHAARSRGARRGREDRRGGDRRRGPEADRLARHSRRQFGARGARQGGRAGAAAGVHRARRACRRRGRLRAQAVHRAQGDLQSRLRLRRRRPRRVLSGLGVVPHRGLQGHGARPSARALLQGPPGPALRDRARARSPALRHQHLPVVAPRPSLSHGRAQRRDQHAARQCELDGGAPGERRLRIVRPRHLEAVADLLRGPVRHRVFRQRPRIPGSRRLFARPCDDDADPRGVGRQPADGSEPPRFLRISRGADRAVGRAGGDGVHRRPPDRRDPRPQRPASGALYRHRRRPCRARLRNRRAAGSRRVDHPQVAPAARQDAARRPDGASHRLRRRNQADAVEQASL